MTEQPEARPCPQTSPHPAHRYMLGLLVHQCPGTAEQPVHPYATLDPDDGPTTAAIIDAGAIDDYPGRKLLDQMIDAELLALYDRVEQVQAAKSALKRAHVALAEQAGRDQAANARVRALAEHLDMIASSAFGTPVSGVDRAIQSTANLIREALDEPREPRP